jgi:AMMECR1 domain-containing protein
MAKFCFTNLTYYLYTGQPISVPEEFNEIKVPLYVTWLREGELRGCVGTN